MGLITLSHVVLVFIRQIFVHSINEDEWSLVGSLNLLLFCSSANEVRASLIRWSDDYVAWHGARMDNILLDYEKSINDFMNMICFLDISVTGYPVPWDVLVFEWSQYSNL